MDYPDHALNRLTTLFRPLVTIPIAVVLAALHHDLAGRAEEGTRTAAATGGLLVLAPALMIVFRRKYLRWWFDWNRELLRFSKRVGAYFLLMDDENPSTDQEQHVHLDVPYPDVPRELSADPRVAEAIVCAAPLVPSLTWGRDELRAGDMWNSNSAVAWLLEAAGLPADEIRPPNGGAAPGWRAGAAAIRRPRPTTRPSPPRRSLRPRPLGRARHARPRAAGPGRRR